MDIQLWGLSLYNLLKLIKYAVPFLVWESTSGKLKLQQQQNYNQY